MSHSVTLHVSSKLCRCPSALHSGSKWLKPAKNKLTWSDVTSFSELQDLSDFCTASIYIPGYALGIWICGWSLFYKRELWASKSAWALSTKTFKISGCKRWCPKDLRVRAPAAHVFPACSWHQKLNSPIHELNICCPQILCVVPERIWQLLTMKQTLYDFEWEKCKNLFNLAAWKNSRWHPFRLTYFWRVLTT